MSKKFFVFLCLFFITSNMVFAQSVKKSKQTVGVVIVGTNDFKSQNFYDYLDDQLKSETNAYNLVVGKVPQNKWVNYWMAQGFLGEQTPKKNDLIYFTQFSQYDKVLFLIVKSPETEKSRRPAGWFNSYEKTRVSVMVIGVLASPENIINSFSVTKQDDSQWSDMRAKMGAMKKSARDIGKALKPYFAK